MIQITRVDIVDGQTLDIELNNGHLILFDIQRIPEAKHKYDVLNNLNVLPRPYTDGMCIYWQNGLHISLDEIIRWLSIYEG